MKLLIAKHVLAACVFACTTQVTAQNQTTKLDFERCYISHNAVEIDAECATFLRPENPNKPNGKQIELFVAKLPSNSPNPEADAFTIIQGGPGGSSVDMAISFRQVLNIIRLKRDILIVDQRGTGRSNGLYCDTPDEDQISMVFDQAQTAKFTQDCRTKLADHDLAFYTTSVAVQDLDALRAAAGYQQLTLYGVSYGTRVAQHYLRRFPENTRAIIIDGVVDVGLNLAGAEIARRSQDAFDGMVKRCNQTPSCVNEFGDIAIKFKELRQRLINTPIDLELAHPLTGKSTSHTLSEIDLLGAVRLMPYSTEGIALLPMLIANAHSGHYLSLAAQAIAVTESFSADFATGMHNSVVCAEDAPFVEANAAAKSTNTYFGSDMIDGIRTACENWPKGLIDSDFREPFDSEKPVLILSGETDPITPPANGERAAKMFNNSKHLIVPSHGHGVIGRGCMPFLIRDFVLSADLNDVKPGCIERERSMPFFIDGTGPKP